jgi:threonyl-tRNA synthetase
MLIIGEKEVAEEKVSLRRQGKGDEGTQSLPGFIEMIQQEVKNKTIYNAAT